MAGLAPPLTAALFGAEGWIAGQLRPLLEAAGMRVVAPPPGLRAGDEAAVREYLAAARPDRVVCALGRTHGPGCGTIDFLEEPAPDGARDRERLAQNLRDNLHAPLSLALCCADAGLHFTYVGTGCIFEYDAQGHPGPFGEDDDPNFFGSAYSVVKGFTDRLMRQLSGRHRVLQARIRMPVTADRHPRNFITKLVGYERVCSVPNSMTVLPALLPRLAELVRRGHVGTLNLVNPGALSHDELLAMYRDVVDPAFAWRSFGPEEQARVLRARRSNNELDTSALQALFPDVLHVRDAVRVCLERMAADDGGRRAT